MADEEREPVVIDWRAPVAEPFYRATGRNPMGLARRRHFANKGRQVLAIEDELFGEGHLGVTGEAPGGLSGYSTLLAALETRRTGQLGDIVGTIQAQQDEIIRSPQAGVLIVQGGPGTGKTVVALHRAAYLLYTYRFPLEDQGVLVVGPNRVFLRYIEQVLPSLGEAGVELVVLSDLVPDVDLGASETRRSARVKGDARMARVLAKAVHDRERPLREDLVVPFGVTSLRLTVEASDRIVKAARRRFRRHNAARRFVETEVFAAMAATGRIETTGEDVRDRTRHLEQVREALERMWPVLTPARAAARPLRLPRPAAPRRVEVAVRRRVDGPLSPPPRARQHQRQRCGLVGRRHRAPGRGTGAARAAGQPQRNDADGEIRTYGHIVVDEVQDLTPMQLRMVARRSLNGSMTVVGDIAQATGPFAPDDWSEVLAHLPDRRPARVVELTIGYRIPEQIMAMANRILRVAAPQIAPPVAVREGDAPPEVRRVPPDELGAGIAEAVRELQGELGEAGIAVVSPASLVDDVTAALTVAGIAFGVATRRGLEADVSVVPVDLAKGLELDGVVLVEPARIVAEERQGLRALYVALTRSTKRLTIVHAQPLPEALVDRVDNREMFG